MLRTPAPLIGALGSRSKSCRVLCASDIGNRIDPDVLAKKQLTSKQKLISIYMSFAICFMGDEPVSVVKLKFVAAEQPMTWPGALMR